MLVLSRRTGQSVFIGDGIEVRVLRVEGDNVWLGFTAPAEVRIRRDELLPREVDEIDEPEDEEEKTQ